MKKLQTLFIVATLLFLVNEAHAQNKFAVTLQGGYGTGAYKATYSGLGPGKFAFRINASYTVLPVLDTYISYVRTGFGCNQSSGGFCNKAPDFTSSGFNVGVRLNHPPGANKWIPWLRAGITYQTLKTKVNKVNFSDSNSGIGFEVGAGIAYPVTRNIKIVPSINYSRYSITDKNGNDWPVVVIMGLVGVRYEF